MRAHALVVNKLLPGSALLSIAVLLTSCSGSDAPSTAASAAGVAQASARAAAEQLEADRAALTAADQAAAAKAAADKLVADQAAAVKAAADKAVADQAAVAKAAAAKVAAAKAAADKAAAAKKAAAGNGVSLAAVQREAIRQWNHAYASTSTATGATCTADGGGALKDLSVGASFNCDVTGSDGSFTNGVGAITRRSPFFTLTLLTD